MKLTQTYYEKDLYPEITEASATEFGRDCLDLTAERLARGTIDRRTFLRIATFLGALPLAATARGAHAAAQELVLASWGGASTPGFTKAFIEPFEKDTGIKVAIDGTGPLMSKIRAMVQARSVVWDVLDFDASKALVLDVEGLLEPIDYSIVSRDMLPKGWAYHAAVVSYCYSCVLTYDKSKFTKPPQTWRDFWNLKDFPGMRLLRKTPEGMIEACMMAAGRSIKDVYPIDLDLAAAKVKEIRSQLLTYNTGAEMMDYFRSGEVTVGNLWHTRSNALSDETQGRITWTWNEGLLNLGAWSVPKGNPGGREATMRFIRSMQEPTRQVELLVLLASGPSNPAAAALVPDSAKAKDPTQLGHRAVQAELNPEWWNAPSGKRNLTNDALAREVWLEALA